MFMKSYFTALSFLFFTQQTSMCVLSLNMPDSATGKTKINKTRSLPSRSSGSEKWERQTYKEMGMKIMCIGKYTLYMGRPRW